MAWTTARTWIVGEKPSAAQFNAHIRDNLNAIAAAGIDEWASYTATWTASSVNPALVDGTTAGSYCQIGKTVVAYFTQTAGASTTYGTGTYSWALPVTAAAALKGGGIAEPTDAGVAAYSAIIKIATTTTMQIGTGGTTQTYMTPTSPFTMGSGDVVRGNLVYQAA